MSVDREQVLGNIRRGLARGRGPVSAGAPPPEPSQARPRLLPQRVKVGHQQLLDLFVAMAVEAACTVERLQTRAAVPAAVARLTQSRQPAPEIVLAPAADITCLPWQTDTELVTRVGRAEGSTQVTVTLAFAGIAETGTLMLTSGVTTPTSLNFLPALHIVVLSASRIVGAYEEAWDLLQQEAGEMPRTVNFITGPSRSGDIGQTLYLGAHGPLQVHILLIGEDPPLNPE